MTRSFLWIARAEGLSLVALVGIAVPLKYLADWSHATTVPGWIHGILFIAYLVALGQNAAGGGWGIGRIAAAFVASLVPFGTFAFERYVARTDGTAPE